MAAKREKIHFASVDELLGAPNLTGEGTEMLKLESIHSFKNHPFKVIDDDKMSELKESIKVNGILSPVLVRPDGKGGYEMISGHRRMHAASMLGLDMIPAIVKEMSDDEAVIVMVDSNVQREEILPSERAFSLKMKMDALKRQGKRTDLEETSGTECQKLTGDQVGESFGLKDRQVRKYVKLTDLSPELMRMVDEKQISIALGYEIAFFDKEVQQWIYEYRLENGFIRPEQIEALKKEPGLANMTQHTIILALNRALPEIKTSGKVALSEKKLNKFFPPHMSSREREKIILNLLTKWKEEQEG